MAKRNRLTIILAVSLPIIALVLSSCNLPINQPNLTTGATPTIGQVELSTPTSLPVETDTPVVTESPVPATPTLTPAADCDRIQFVIDVNYPDGAEVKANEKITKTWQVKNVGSCPWDSTYKLVFIRGEKMDGPSPADVITNPVPPGSTVDLSVQLTTPNINGTHWGVWQIFNGAGKPVLKADGTPQELSILISIKEGEGGLVTSVRTWSYTFAGAMCTNSVEYEISATIYASGPVAVKYTWNVTSGYLTEVSQNYTFDTAGNKQVTTQIKPPFADPNNVKVTITANGVSSSFTICP